jgi:hypothetical protein
MLYVPPLYEKPGVILASIENEFPVADEGPLLPVANVWLVVERVR